MFKDRYLWSSYKYPPFLYMASSWRFIFLPKIRVQSLKFGMGMIKFVLSLRVQLPAKLNFSNSACLAPRVLQTPPSGTCFLVAVLQHFSGLSKALALLFLGCVNQQPRFTEPFIKTKPSISEIKTKFPNKFRLSYYNRHTNNLRQG